MAKLNVCCRLPSQGPTRFQVLLESFNDKSDSLYSEIKKQLKATDGEFDIIYCGQVLQPEKPLSSYSLQSLSTVYVVRKFTSRRNQTATEAVGGPTKNEVTMAIQSALLNLEYRTIVEKMLNDPDSVENIITTTPGLDKDPSVLAMLQEPELLAVLAHPNNMDSLLQQHPSFAQAAITIATAVNEEGAKSGSRPGGAGLSFSMDQMSDEDDDDMAQPSRTRPVRGGAGQSITASQLAAALQAATGGASTSGASPIPPVAVMPSSEPGAGPSGSGMTITSDFFQQAMAHAQSSSSDAALQQLRDMGITDENVARQALAATGGDIQAAIDLIFGDGMM